MFVRSRVAASGFSRVGMLEDVAMALRHVNITFRDDVNRDYVASFIRGEVLRKEFQ